MNKELIVSNKAYVSKNPLSQALKITAHNEWLYLAGQLGVSHETGELQVGIENETTQIMENIQAVIEEADYQMNDIVRATIFVTDLCDGKVVNEIYAKYFSKPYPCRSLVEVSKLALGATVEIECTACK